MTFVHLHRHSEFSVLDGMGSAEQYAARAADLGQFALAQTDHANLCGALEHIQACNKYDLHPIVGVEAYFRPDRRVHDVSNKKVYHMVLHADGLRGWRSLMRLTSESFQAESFYGKPCIDYALLEKHKEGLIVTTACISSYFNQSILNAYENLALTHLERLQEIFGDKVYCEIMPHDFQEQRWGNEKIVEFANRYGIPVIATVDAHYVLKGQDDTQQIVKMMATQATFQDLKERREAGEDTYNFTDKVDTLYLMSEDELRDEFIKNHTLAPEIIQSAIDNTEYLASQVNPFTLDKSLKLPRIRGKQQTEVVLRDWCDEGLNRIGEENNPLYRLRLEQEFDVLREKDVLDYFVIIGELVRWAKDEGIRVGPGRGSAAGCLVSYLCNITAVDPMKYDLLFERFLNPDRAGMPDIDMDFQSDKIEEVLKIFMDRHGEDKVSKVISYQTFKAKSAIKDVARVFNVPIPEANRATNALDNVDLDEGLHTSKNLQEFQIDYPEVVRHAQILEGSVKNFSQHAAAIVVTDKPVTSYMPTMKARKESPVVTAWSDKPSSPIISDYGFLKYDFLSTTGLAIQKMACEFIHERHGITLDLDALPAMRDPHDVDDKAMQLFRDGHTFGLFQFGGSAGITGMLKKMQPKSILDLAACNALYRPGPLDGGVAQEYIDKSTGKLPVTYWHKLVEVHLKETYGIMIYQEQLMKLCEVLGDFTAGQADDMRKATGKLYRLGKEEAKQFMGRFKEQWDNGISILATIDNDTAEEIWNKILAFGGYSFNKSHSVSYSLQAYQDAYLKANYPEEFYTALMVADPDKIPTAVREATSRGIRIQPPDINKSKMGMFIDDGGIRCGLISVKGVGDKAVDEIMKHRPYKNLEDFNSKITKQRCNKRVVSALWNVGAFDSLDLPMDGQLQDRPTYERELLGFTITGNKMKEYLPILEEVVIPDEIELTPTGAGCIVGGELAEITWKLDRRGDRMCWLTIALGADKWRVTVFASMVPKYEELMVQGSIVLARVTVDDRGGFLLQYLTTPDEYQKIKGA